jgi:hypothetical protein
MRIAPNLDRWKVLTSRVDHAGHFLPSLRADERRYVTMDYGNLRCLTGLNGNNEAISSILAGTSLADQADDAILYLLATGQESRHADLDELLPHALQHAAEAGFTGVATSYLGALDNRTIWALGWMKSTRYFGWEYMGRTLMASLVDLKWKHLGVPR